VLSELQQNLKLLRASSARESAYQIDGLLKQIERQHQQVSKDNFYHGIGNLKRKEAEAFYRAFAKLLSIVLIGRSCGIGTDGPSATTDHLMSEGGWHENGAASSMARQIRLTRDITLSALQNANGNLLDAGLAKLIEVIRFEHYRLTSQSGKRIRKWKQPIVVENEVCFQHAEYDGAVLLSQSRVSCHGMIGDTNLSLFLPDRFREIAERAMRSELIFNALSGNFQSGHIGGAARVFGKVRGGRDGVDIEFVGTCMPERFKLAFEAEQLPFAPVVLTVALQSRMTS
jgi:hypothetical protein